MIAFSRENFMTASQIFRGTLIVLLTLAGAYIVLISVRLVIVLLLALIIASAVRPLVIRLTKWRLPQTFAVVLTYLLLALLIAVMALAVLPPLVNQVANYIENDWQLSFRIIQAQNFIVDRAEALTGSNIERVPADEIRASVSSLVAQVRRVIPDMMNDLGGTLGDAVLIFVMGAYWLTSHQKATDFAGQLVPPSSRAKTKQIIAEIESTMGSYVRGVVSIALIVGSLNFFGFQLLGVPNALTLSFIQGVATTIPMIGGLIGGIIIVTLTLVSDPQHVISVFVVFFIVQQLESYLLSPRIMASRVGIDPLLVIVYTAIGFIMFGVTGALIAVPIMGTLHILLWHLVIEPHQNRMERQVVTSNGLVLGHVPPEQEHEGARAKPS